MVIRADALADEDSRGDSKWLPLFQARFLNFDKTIVERLGLRLSLQNKISENFGYRCLKTLWRGIGKTYTSVYV